MNEHYDDSKLTEEQKQARDEYLKELDMKGTEVEVAAIHFAFTITMDEAKALIEKPKSQIACKLKQYIVKVLNAGAKKMLETEGEETVTDCKVYVE